MKHHKKPTKRKDKYEELAGDFKNEAELEEELDDEALEAGEVEEKHFEEGNEPAI